MAIPMKRQMINIEQLRFPSGIAAAETLAGLHSRGDRAMRSARALGIACLLAAVNQFWHDGMIFIRESLDAFSSSTLVERLNKSVFGQSWMNRTVCFDWDPIFLAAGRSRGFAFRPACFSAARFAGRSSCRFCSIMASSRSNSIPIPRGESWCSGRSGAASPAWLLPDCSRSPSNGAASCEPLAVSVACSLKDRRELKGEMDEIEMPVAWFLDRTTLRPGGHEPAGARNLRNAFWQSFWPSPLSSSLALVACRVTGETDTTPVGAMGKVTQLLFGGLSPGNMNVNLMAANITAGAATSSADLLTDLKSGYLLGATASEFIAQFAGIFCRHRW